MDEEEDVDAGKVWIERKRSMSKGLE